MDKQKKICIVHRYPISLVKGTNPSFSLILSKLLTSGCKVYYLSFKGDKEAEIPGIISLPINLIFKREKPLGKLFKSLLFTFLIPWKILKINNKENLDLVYCDDSLPFYGYLIKKIAHVKTIIRLGDLQSGYAFASGGKIKKLIFKIVFGFEKKMWKSLDGLIVISDAFNKFLIENNIPVRKIHSVQECLDFDTFRPKKIDKNLYAKYGLKNTPIVMFHGAIMSCKGLNTLIKAVPIVLKKYPQTQFVIVGDGGSLKSAKKLANKLNLSNSIKFTGWISFKKIPDLINICSIGIPMRSSNLANNFVVTTALLQYWAMEKPIIAPKLEAIEKIVNSAKGLLFQPDDYEDLAKKIIFSLENLTMLKEHGIRGRKKAIADFNIDLVSEKLSSVLKNYLISN